ncbi:uncharacterized protein [Clytia hemisphaerica]|uniref:G-protein coupled receptors family 1 profile domain-containing protein n=1 Tax=Clytia hemisphaerica TaxID=252671 RepID=A0A7M5VEK3_9CNID
MSNNTTIKPTDLLPVEAKDIPQIIICIVGFLGNLVVISAIIFDKRLQTSLNYLVLNLSFCNICVVVFSIPFQLLTKRHHHDFIFGELGCQLIYPFATWAVNVSVSSLLTITIERWIAIVHPMTWRSCQKHTLKMIFANHVYGYVTIIPYAVHIRLAVIPGTELRYCAEIWDTGTAKFYTILLFLLQYLLPLALMMFFYTSAWIHLKRQNDHTIRLSEEARTARSMSLRLNNEEEIRARFAKRGRTESILSTTYSGEAKDMCLMFCLKMFRVSNYYKRTSSSASSSYDNADYFIANGRRRQTIRTFFMFLLIIVIFAISSLPNQIIWLVYSFKQGAKFSESVTSTFVIFHYLNYIMNPFIYGGLNKYFLRAYKRLFLCSHSEENNNTSTTLAPPCSPGLTGHPDLFREGIITRNPVNVISAGSLDSIYEEAEEEDEWSVATDKDQTPVSSPPMSTKRVKFKFSVTSNPFRKLSTISNMSDQEKKERRHRKISQALVQDRQRKLTLPALAASTSINHEDKARIRKHSVPAQIQNPKAFIFDDSFSVLPPTRVNSSSLKDKLNLLTSRVSPRSSVTEILNNNTLPTKAVTSRRRKTGIFNMTDSGSFETHNNGQKSCFDQISEESEVSSHSERSSLLSHDSLKRNSGITHSKTFGGFHRNSYIDSETNCKRSSCYSQQSFAESTNSLDNDCTTTEQPTWYNNRSFDLKDGSYEDVHINLSSSNENLIDLKRNLLGDLSKTSDNKAEIVEYPKLSSTLENSDSKQNIRRCSNTEIDCDNMEESQSCSDNLINDSRACANDFRHNPGQETRACANDSDNEELDKMLEEIENLRDSWYLDGSSDVQEQFCYLLAKLEKHSLTRHLSTSKNISTQTSDNRDLEDSSRSSCIGYEVSDEISSMDKRQNYKDYDFDSLDEMPESYL